MTRYGLVELPLGETTEANLNNTGATMKPSICRSVIYRAKIINHDGQAETFDRPAVVSFVYEDGAVDLTWFGRGGHQHAGRNAEHVEYNEAGKEAGTWRWPPGAVASPAVKPSVVEEK
jgi:hypothetical protein